ncbi:MULTISPECIES: peroxiredoxin-like family protein [unclassified Pseudoalteromonas]|uniref:peroxiredoxin-like family protein n=1 Tax=unclassified Pseudoalteromonas TaxID=194690 RepID=UPI000C074F67|nr:MULTISPECIES: peroxiredoxin-like family protein [unclassified Pseudoalteromonas]MDB2355627.1 AhpC/TSA family protein [Pseudoalteromonas sp.]MDP2635506.1 peroxiredoxin-like family protein [Pseudoalteromonas sp. 1_MG-2023]PHN89108.1 thioredoxin peroxidase [Pseudoalteromonas sp. 3D05]
MNKITAPADIMPTLTANDVDGKSLDITERQTELPWKMIVIYRGKHCPLCTKQLNALAKIKDDYTEAGIEVAAVSADSQEQLNGHLKDLEVNFPLYSGLTLEQMTDLGVYISEPRNKNETDHPFAEPAIFVLNEDNQIQITDKSNAPFSRPDLNALLSGIKFIRENDYPIRGTFAP